MTATQEFKTYLNSLTNDIDPIVHDKLWDLLIKVTKEYNK